jgi:formylglycine-generating enzyme required for sulfatase activity
MTKTSRCCTHSRDGGVAQATASPSIAPSATLIKRRWSQLPGGRFSMGSHDGRFAEDGEGPIRDVTLSPFAIACHAVSNTQFANFVRATGYTTDAERYGWSFVFAGFVNETAQAQIGSRAGDTPWWIPVPRAYWAQPEGPHSSVIDRVDHPVVHVSWNDARAYCDWSSTALPTEAQWEYAARGGIDQALYPWGDELMPGGEHRCNIWQGDFPSLNTAEDGYRGTAPVHAFAPNGYGLFNMAGNVWEWCADAFATDYHRITSAIDPLHNSESNRRSLRGGSYLCHESYCNRYRVAARSANTPDSTAGNIGFRVVARPQ